MRNSAHGHCRYGLAHLTGSSSLGPGFGRGDFLEDEA